jgi:Lon protease-like protein
VIFMVIGARPARGLRVRPDLGSPNMGAVNPDERSPTGDEGSEMAMFPLGTVLVPGMSLPLHVFEKRYRVMMDRCLAASREFGVTLIERGSEVGGGDVRTAVGAVARILEADQAPDGRWGVLAVGTRRIRVRSWLDDDPYPRALVSEWPDVKPQNGAAVESAYTDLVRRARSVLAQLAELGFPARPLAEIDSHPDPGLWELALMLPFGAMDRYHLLCSDGPASRVVLMAELMDGLEIEVKARMAEG